MPFEAFDFVRRYLDPLLAERGLPPLIENLNQFEPLQGASGQMLTMHHQSVDLSQGANGGKPWQTCRVDAVRLVRSCLAKAAAKGVLLKRVVLILHFHENQSETDFQAFAEGLLEALSEFGLKILAISAFRASFGSEAEPAKSSEAQLTAIGLGEVYENTLANDRALKGQLLCVSGVIGRAALGARLLESGSNADWAREIREDERDFFVSACLRPQPQLNLGAYLADQAGVKAAQLIEHGLIPDLRAFTLASNLGIKLDRAALPFARADCMKKEQLLKSADHELLFAIDEPHVAKVRCWFPSVRVIGKFCARGDNDMTRVLSEERESEACALVA